MFERQIAKAGKLANVIFRARDRTTVDRHALVAPVGEDAVDGGRNSVACFHREIWQRDLIANTMSFLPVAKHAAQKRTDHHLCVYGCVAI